MRLPPIIAPIPLLTTGGLPSTDTHICYASLVLKYKDYAQFYREKSLEGETVILDHSPSLPRNPTPTGQFLRVIEYIKPRAIVLPDRDFDRLRTMGLVQNFLEQVKSLPSVNSLPTIGVLQGTNVKELEQVYNWMKDRVTAIGLHSGIENILQRNQLVEELGIRYPAVLIEVHKDLMEETPKSRVIDLGWTSFPIRLAYQGRKVNSIHPTPPPLDFGEEYHPPLLKQNLLEYIKRFSNQIDTRQRIEQRVGTVEG